MGVIGLYSVNKSWIIPAPLSPTHTTSLGISDKIVSSQNTLETLSLDIKRTQLTYADCVNQRSALSSLLPAISKAIFARSLPL